MTGADPVYLSALGVVNGLGRGKRDVLAGWLEGRRGALRERRDLLADGAVAVVGEVEGDLPAPPPALAALDSRNSRILMAALDEIRPEIDAAVAAYGPERVAVVMGTSTSGMSEGEAAAAALTTGGALPAGFDMRRQELGAVGEFAARYLGLAGPAYTVSTACSSGALALVSAARLLRGGLADAVVAGGADSLCRLTLNGFKALSALSAGVCNPFSRNRDGTMIGEGAAAFLMERRPANVALLGAGTSSDAHSMTAPEPEGAGVEAAVRDALADAGLTAADIDFIELHGTGTEQNDLVESKVIRRVFGDATPAHSSKGQIGHTLGAAGAMGAALCWLLADDTNPAVALPPQVWDGAPDDGLLSASLVGLGETLPADARRRFVCNAFGFGGNNVSLVIGRAGA